MYLDHPNVGDSSVTGHQDSLVQMKLWVTLISDHHKVPEPIRKDLVKVRNLSFDEKGRGRFKE